MEMIAAGSRFTFFFTDTPRNVINAMRIIFNETESNLEDKTIKRFTKLCVFFYVNKGNPRETEPFQDDRYIFSFSFSGAVKQ